MGLVWVQVCVRRVHGTEFSGAGFGAERERVSGEEPQGMFLCHPVFVLLPAMLIDTWLRIGRSQKNQSTWDEPGTWSGRSRRSWGVRTWRIPSPGRISRRRVPWTGTRIRTVLETEAVAIMTDNRGCGLMGTKI